MLALKLAENSAVRQVRVFSVALLLVQLLAAVFI
jgi:hypothetical protein